MLTGDAKKVAEQVAGKLGVDEVKKLLPADKVIEVEKLLNSKGKMLAFVGDGINDAPVLSRADIGIAMVHLVQMRQLRRLILFLWMTTLQR